LNNPCLLVKTALGMEKIAASRISELLPWTHTEPSPRGFRGLVLIYNCRGGEKEIVEKNVLEADRIIPVMGIAKANPQEISKVARTLARDKISHNECFAVRTTRRGSHKFTSIDVNVIVGAAVKEETNACVNLSYPDKILLVEIIQDIALLSIVPGSFEWKKMRPGKNQVIKLFRRISIIQMPYLGPLEACRKMGVRIGREVQNFEVKELVVAPAGPVDGKQLAEFLNGVFEGIESRYKIQAKSYHRKPRKVPVIVHDIHQAVRDRLGEPIIVLEPEGEPISRVADKLWDLVRNNKRINILVGSRQGIPLGIYRFADVVVDIAPGITLSTEYAASSALIALATILHDRLSSLGEEDSGSIGSGEGGKAQAHNGD